MKKDLIRILICDDDKYFRMAIKEMLEKHGLIDEAADEQTAKDLINGNYYDLALIDMEIDGPLSGINLLQEAKKKSIHSIILSSQGDEKVVELAYENNCDHFLSKSQYRTYLDPYILK